MPLGRRDAEPARGTPTPAHQAGIAGSVVTAAQLLPLVLPNGRTLTGARQGISTGRAGAPSTRPEVELYIPAQFIDSCVFLD